MHSIAEHSLRIRKLTAAAAGGAGGARWLGAAMALRWHVWLLAAAKLAAGGGQRHLFADPTGPSADRPTGPLESVHGATFVINPPQRQREPVLAPRCVRCST